MITTYKAAPDIDVLTSHFPDPRLRPHPDQRVRAPRRRARAGRHRRGRRERRVHGRAADGHRSRRPAVDLAHPHRLRPHRHAAPAARREPAAAGHHHLPRRGHHGPVGAAADGPGASRQPGPDDHRRRPHPDAVKPPAFDNPVTTGFHDDKSGALFSSDCFGALLPGVPERAEDLSDDDLRQGQVFWATVDSPWLHKVDPGVFAKELDGIREHGPADGPEQPPAGGAGRHRWTGSWPRSRPRRPHQPSSGPTRRPSSRCWPR